MTNETMPALNVGDRVKFDGDRRWWDVRAADDRYVILTRQAAFQPAGIPVYTIVDWERDLRGPCNRLKNGWDMEDPDGPEKLLTALNSTGVDRVEVSGRRNTPVVFGEVRTVQRAAA
jgi:hypothetical protein